MSHRYRARYRAGLAGVTAALLAGLASPAPAEGQYFGRNQVNYDSFEFEVLQTEHFDVHYYPRERVPAEAAARMAERWYYRLSTVLRHQLNGRQPLVLYATAPEFQQTNVVSGIAEGTGGVTEALRRRIVLPIGGTLRDLDHVLGHELVHAFQYDITGGGGPNTYGAMPGAAALPLWFIEGMAEYLSLGSSAPLTAMWMRGALEDTLPSYGDLLDPRFFPYRYGQALLAYVAGRWGDPIMGDLLRAAGRSRNVDLGIQAVLAMTPDQLVAEWHNATYAAYQDVRVATQPAESVGVRVIVPEDDDDVGYNLAPSISPDGNRLMFLSNRDLFSIDLFLADARTGKVLRRLTQTAVDNHLQSLQFIQSAGSWRADGRQFVFAGIANGRGVLQLYDVEKGDKVREVRLPQLGEVFNPSWSPDGRSIAFSGVVNGLSDLYVYDLESDSLRQLTDDLYADLQPSWSPDGSTLAFSTDRFGTDLDRLTTAPNRIALLDVASGRIREVPGFRAAKHLNPQWSPDGRGIYFLADPMGITNVYRSSTADGSIAQLTNLFTGVSGITEDSPALSVAAGTGRVAFSIFRTDGYEIHAIEPGEALGGPVIESLPGRPGFLPPFDRSQSMLAGLLQDPSHLPSVEEFTEKDYRPNLSLLYVGQPTLIAGTDQFGTFVGGGAALYFSDLLGNRNLVTGLQVNGSFKDISAVVGYQNVGRRLNWGVSAQQIPFVTGSFARGTATVNGEPALVEQQLIQRQTNRTIEGIVAYPFSHGQRVEFSAGGTYITFDRELQTRAFSLFTGQQILDEDEDLEAGESLWLGTGSGALVFDNSLFGATGPILGQRYRLELSPTFGSINYMGTLVDFRRYFMPKRPFTLAARLLHYGRYGSGGEDPRLQPLFVGWPGLVRGYTNGSFDARECDPPPGDPTACPVYDQLLGSRVLVGNVELRFPLFGVLGLGHGYYGALPLDFTIFGDGGLAWDSNNEPSFSGGDREPVFSAGAGFRFNLFGFAVAEVNLVRPFDRPAKSWIWEFNFQPGF